MHVRIHGDKHEHTPKQIVLFLGQSCFGVLDLGGFARDELFDFLGHLVDNATCRCQRQCHDLGDLLSCAVRVWVWICERVWSGSAVIF